MEVESSEERDEDIVHVQHVLDSSNETQLDDTLSKRSKRRLMAQRNQRARTPQSHSTAASQPLSNNTSPTLSDTKEFKNQARIQQVLKTLKDDVVTLNPNSDKNKSRWKTMVENMQQGPLDSLYPNNNEGDEQYGSNNTHHHHEQVDRSEVGADIYSNKWRRLMVNKALSKPDLANIKHPESGSSGDQNVILTNTNESSTCGTGNCLQLLTPLNFMHKLCYYFSGLLAGLLIWPALFSISNVKGESLLVQGPTFWTLSSLLTTFLVLTVAVGFMNSVVTVTARENALDFWKMICHFVPVLLILVSHYVNKALELQNMECKAYLSLKPEKQHRTYLSYSCDRYAIGKNGISIADMERDVGFLFIQSIPCLAAIGIYTYLYFSQNCVNNHQIPSIHRKLIPPYP